jgi:hypothetical protein
MSTKEQKEIFDYQTTKEHETKERELEYCNQNHTYTIKDRITPQIRKKFLLAIKQTKDSGKEHGFHICMDNNGKLSPGEMCIGNECSIKLQQMSMPCAEKKVQGDFHTHPYLEDVKKYFNITFHASDQLMKSAVRQFIEKKGLTITTPSHSDARGAILGKCAKKTNGTTCIGTDLDDSRVECWIPKDIHDDDCVRALVDRLDQSVSKEEKSTIPHEWIRPLFNVEMIDLKTVKRKN